VIPPSGTIAFWVVALVVFLIVEAVTAGLVSIWFVFGSLVALICAALGAAVWLQIFWFVIVSVATLVLTRPLVKRYVDSRSVATNADRSIGRAAVVTERIDNLAATGAVKLDGVVWTARSTDDAVAIETGERVTVRAIEGVKLIVERSVR
jgi:membrane protein implicated in regulation of membrane protease activity